MNRLIPVMLQIVWTIDAIGQAFINNGLFPAGASHRLEWGEPHLIVFPIRYVPSAVKTTVRPTKAARIQGVETLVPPISRVKP